MKRFFLTWIADLLGVIRGCKGVRASRVKPVPTLCNRKRFDTWNVGEIRQFIKELSFVPILLNHFKEGSLIILKLNHLMITVLIYANCYCLWYCLIVLICSYFFPQLMKFTIDKLNKNNVLPGNRKLGYVYLDPCYAMYTTYALHFIKPLHCSG